MKRYYILKLGTVVSIFLMAMLSACEQPVSPEPEKTDVVYTVNIKTPEHGGITAIPEQGIEGAEIKFSVNPEPGYKLKVFQVHNQGISIASGANQTNVNQNVQSIYYHPMPKGGIYVTAEFVPLEGNERSVSLEVGEHGTLIAVPTSGAAGTKVRIYNYIDPGYSFKSGYPRLSGASWAAGKDGYEFTIGGENIKLSAEFEKPDGVDGVLTSARNAIAAEEYDTAFSFYEIAYQADRNNPEAIFYSTLGRLLSIGTNSKVRVLLRKTGMLTTVPGIINDWLNFETARSTSWLTEYTDDDGDTYKLPRLHPVDGNIFPSGFLNYDIYKDNVGRRMVFDVLLFWNMIGNNPAGFNDFLDDALKYIFGADFEEACSRSAAWPEGTGDAPVELLPAIKTKFNLDTIYGSGSGTTMVGKAELDVLVAFLRSLKAAVEWAASYDWEMDLTLLRMPIGKEDSFNLLLNRSLTSNLKERIDKERKYTVLAKYLPLRSRLMKTRSSEMMNQAGADFTGAVNTLYGSFDAFYGRFDENAKTKYKWLTGSEGFIKHLKDAVDSRGNFYIPEIPRYKSLFSVMENKTAWNVNAANSRHGVNLGKLFTPGYLAADQLITVELSGKAPRFFGFKTGTNGEGIFDTGDIARYDTFSMEFGGNFKDVFVKLKGKTADQYRWVSDIFPDLFPQPDGGDVPDQIMAKENVTLLYDYYQKR
jgi:hypothetical protein